MREPFQFLFLFSVGLSYIYLNFDIFFYVYSKEQNKTRGNHSSIELETKGKQSWHKYCVATRSSPFSDFPSTSNFCCFVEKQFAK